jgi:hypothetical protein
MVEEPLLAGRGGAAVLNGLPATGVGRSLNSAVTVSTARPASHSAAITSTLSRHPS